MNVHFMSPPLTRVSSPRPRDNPPSYDAYHDPPPSSRPRSRSRSRSRAGRGDRNSRIIDSHQAPYYPSIAPSQCQPRPYTPAQQTWSAAAPANGYDPNASLNPQSYTFPQEYGYVDRRGRSPYDPDKSGGRKHRRHSSGSDRSYDFGNEKKRRSRSRRASHHERRRSESPRTIEDDAASERQYRHRRNKTVLGIIGSIMFSVFLCNH